MCVTLEKVGSTLEDSRPAQARAVTNRKAPVFPIRAYVKLLRPYQWTKNSFVLAGLLFGHAWHQPVMVTRTFWAFLAFCLTASGVYILNDIADRDSDRQHPVKRNRPIASGQVPVAIAFALLALLWGGAGSIALEVSPMLGAVLVVYVATNIAYSLRFKHEPILDVFLLASGFVLRIVAGTAAIGIPPSQWLILTGTAISLFLGFVKRRAELFKLGEDVALSRRVLTRYSTAALDHGIVISATIAVVSYGLYTMSPRTVRIHGTENLIYTVPLVLYGILRLLHRLYSDHAGEDPARDLPRDPHILITVLVWIAVTGYLIA
jgi:4-hydroxybenzoate polyprenyltransferase